MYDIIKYWQKTQMQCLKSESSIQLSTAVFDLQTDYTHYKKVMRLVRWCSKNLEEVKIIFLGHIVKRLVLAHTSIY